MKKIYVNPQIKTVSLNINEHLLQASDPNLRITNAELEDSNDIGSRGGSGWFDDEE
jgi:hypothetical protein